MLKKDLNIIIQSLNNFSIKYDDLNNRPSRNSTPNTRNSKPNYNSTPKNDMIQNHNSNNHDRQIQNNNQRQIQNNNQRQIQNNNQRQIQNNNSQRHNNNNSQRHNNNNSQIQMHDNNQSHNNNNNQSQIKNYNQNQSHNHNNNDKQIQNNNHSHHKKNNQLINKQKNNNNYSDNNPRKNKYHYDTSQNIHITQNNIVYNEIHNHINTHIQSWKIYKIILYNDCPNKYFIIKHDYNEDFKQLMKDYNGYWSEEHNGYIFHTKLQDIIIEHLRVKFNNWVMVDNRDTTLYL